MSKRTISLSDDEWDDLVAAKTCTIRPTPHTPKLIKLGLLHGGKSRFGNWLKITEAGERLVSSKLSRTVQSMNRSAASMAAARDVSSERAPQPPSENASRAAVAPQRLVSAGSKVKRNKNATASAKQTTPNAVRLIIGGKVTYYPLTAYESLKHGEKARVFTLNKQRYKSLPMGASSGDVVVH